MERNMQLDLEKQSTEKLDEILHYCLTGDHWKGNEHVILGILDIIGRREQNIHPNITPGAQIAWEEFLRKTREDRGRFSV